MKFLITIENKIIGSATSEVNENNTQIVHDMVNKLKENDEMRTLEYTFFDKTVGMNTNGFIIETGSVKHHKGMLEEL